MSIIERVLEIASEQVEAGEPLRAPDSRVRGLGCLSAGSDRVLQALREEVKGARPG